MGAPDQARLDAFLLSLRKAMPEVAADDVELKRRSILDSLDDMSQQIECKDSVGKPASEVPLEPRTRLARLNRAVDELADLVRSVRDDGEAGEAAHQKLLGRLEEVCDDLVIVQSREELVRSLFQAHDKDSSGMMSVRELRSFAEQNGFKGSDREWHNEYAALCGICVPSGTRGLHVNNLVGIDLDMFSTLVDDDSVPGRRLSDQELQELLAQKKCGLEQRKTWIEPAS